MTSLQAVLSSTSRPELNELSLSRAHEVWEKSGTGSYAILSPGADLDSTASVGRSLKLQALVRDLGYGAIPLVLHVNGAVERVLFVCGVPLQLVERLRKRSGSDWLLFSGVETNSEVVRFTAEGPVENLGGFTPARVAAAFSRPGHDAFFEWRARGFAENLAVVAARRAGRLASYPWPYPEVTSRSVARVSGESGSRS